MKLALQLNAIVATRDWLTLASILPLVTVFGAMHAMMPAGIVRHIKLDLLPCCPPAVRVGKYGKRFAEICGCRYCSRTSVPALDRRGDGGRDRALVRGTRRSVSILTVRTILHVR